MTELEKAAIRFSKPYAENDCVRQDVINAFEAGAEWHAKQSPWISVEERKPKHMQAVWVKSDINNHQQLRFCDGKFYTSFAHQTYDGSVTHWMPIPE